MIEPTVGRVVWVRGVSESEPLLAGIIAKVWNSTMVNLGVFRDNGNCSGFTSVALYQGEGEPPAGMYCEWMPYQKGQAAKAEALELAAVTADRSTGAPP